jgi:hypothetical protein
MSAVGKYRYRAVRLPGSALASVVRVAPPPDGAGENRARPEKPEPDTVPPAERRSRLGLSQRDVERLSGIPRGSIAGVEAGSARPFTRRLLLAFYDAYERATSSAGTG